MDDHDHRSLANRLGLWHIQEDAPGMVFWHPRGCLIIELTDAVRADIRKPPPPVATSSTDDRFG